MWMIFLFKAWCEFGAHYLCNCAEGSLVTLDSKTTPLYSHKTCISYHSLHNRSENITQVNGTTTKKMGKKTLVEFLKSNHQAQQKTCIAKIMSSMSIKHGCQRTFITKQPYLD
jgi:hypothetical protein